MTKCEIINNYKNHYILNYEDSAIMVYCERINMIRLSDGRTIITCYSMADNRIRASIVCDEVIQ